MSQEFCEKFTVGLVVLGFLNAVIIAYGLVFSRCMIKDHKQCGD